MHHPAISNLEPLGITWNHWKRWAVAAVAVGLWNFPGDLHGLYGDTSHRARETRTHFSIELWKIVEADTGKMKATGSIYCTMHGYALLYITMRCHPHGNMALRKEETVEAWSGGAQTWPFFGSHVDFPKIGLKGSLENSLAKSSVQFLWILLGSPSGKKKVWGFFFWEGWDSLTLSQELVTTCSLHLFPFNIIILGIFG